MRSIEVTTPENVPVVYELAGPGSRFLALFIDSFIRTAATALIALGVESVMPDVLAPSQMAPWLIAVLIAVVVALNGGYLIYFETVWNGQTPGKRSLKIRAIREQGLPLDFRAALLRNVLRMVDWLPALYGVGVIAAMVNPEGKRLGDMVAGTVVIREAPESVEVHSPELSATVQLSPVGVDMTLLPLSVLSSDEWAVVYAYLQRAPELEHQTAMHMSRQIALPLLGKLGVPVEQVGQRFHSFLVLLTREYERRSEM